MTDESRLSPIDVRVERIKKSKSDCIMTIGRDKSLLSFDLIHSYAAIEFSEILFKDDKDSADSDYAELSPEKRGLQRVLNLGEMMALVKTIRYLGLSGENARTAILEIYRKECNPSTAIQDLETLLK
jgi:hypothetical protein